jgi:hypothetical protein
MIDFGDFFPELSCLYVHIFYILHLHTYTHLSSILSVKIPLPKHNLMLIGTLREFVYVDLSFVFFTFTKAIFDHVQYVICITTSNTTQYVHVFHVHV